MVGAPGVGHGGGAARRRPRDRDRPGRRPAGRADGALAGRPRRPGRARRERGRAGDGAARAGGERGRRPLPRRAARARAAPARRDGAAAVRARRGARRLAGVRVRARRSRGGGRARRPAGGRRPSGFRARGRGQARHAALRGRGGAAGAARRAAARLPRGPRERAVLRGARGRVHPGDRRARAPVLRLPRLPQAEARERARARHGRGHHPHADGRGVPAARPLQQVLRRGHGPAGAGGARHGRPPRHLRPGLHASLLRGHGLPGPHQLHGELQRPGGALRDRRRAPAGRRSTSSSTRAWTTTT